MLACRKLKKGVPQKWPISMQNDSYPFFHFSARIANMTTQSSSLDIRPFHTALHHVSSWNAQILDHVQRCVGHYVDYFGASTLIVSFLLLPLRRPCRNERALKLGVPLFFSHKFWSPFSSSFFPSLFPAHTRRSDTTVGSAGNENEHKTKTKNSA